MFQVMKYMKLPLPIEILQNVRHLTNTSNFFVTQNQYTNFFELIFRHPDDSQKRYERNSIFNNLYTLTIQSKIVIRKNRRFIPRTLNGDHQIPAVRFHDFLHHGRVVSREGTYRRKLQLDVLQFDVVHAVRRHRAVEKICRPSNSIRDKNNLMAFLIGCSLYETMELRCNDN